MSSCRKPCPSCPWRVGQDASAIPNFSLELAENLRGTCEQDFGAPVFACHQSREGEEIVCAGWLAVYGVLHSSFDEVIEKLRASA